MRIPISAIFTAMTISAGTAQAEDRPKLPPPPLVEHKAALCLPMVFMEHMLCLNGTPVAKFDSCRILASRSETIIQTETKHVQEREVLVRRIEMALNKDQINTMLDGLYSTFETSDDHYVRSSLSANQHKQYAAFIIPVLESALEKLENSGLCETITESPQLRFPDLKR